MSDRSQPKSRRAPAANSKRDWALSRDDIVDAALAFLDEGGTQGFSMRQLAARLDVTVAAIYWHFDGLDDLFQHVARRLVGYFDTRVEPDEPWDTATRRILRSVWETALRHPALFDIQQTQPIPTSAGPGQPLLHALLVVLRDAGFPPNLAVDHARSTLWITLGMIRGAQAMIRRLEPSPQTEQTRFEVAVASDADIMSEFQPQLSTLDLDSLFDTTLETVIDGLRSQLSPDAT